ncbi:MAG: sigma 54-interacting transcriptional regulator [Candidatus Eisenbacteria sp.]|nr:sigma 54-interacting transcriptional regulator [Candidatus Eisenbacteria bacterium]
MKHERRDRSHRSGKGHPQKENLQPTDSLRLLEDLGDIYFSADAYPQALEQYKHALSNVSPEEGLDLHLQVVRCHHAQGEYQEALEALSRIEETCASNLDSRARGVLLALYGHTFRALGQYEQAKEACEGALDALRGSGEDREIASVGLCLGAVLHRQGLLERARRMYEDALSYYRQVGDQTGVAMAFNNLGLVYMNLCQWARAAEYLVEAREIAEVQGNYAKVAVRTANLGIIRFHQGRWKEADQNFRRALRVYREIGYSRGTAKVSIELARLERVRRRWGRAQALLEEGLRLSQENGYKREISVAHEFLGELNHDLARFEEAESHYSRGLELAEVIAPQSDHVSEICRRWAELSVASGDAGQALNLAERALAMAIRIQDRLEEGLSHRALGRAHEKLGDREQAREHLEQAAEHLRRSEEPYELARTLLALGDFYSAHPAQGSDEKSLDLLREAGEILESLGDRRGSASAVIHMARLLLRLGRADGCLGLLDRAETLLEEEREGKESGQIEALRGEVEKHLLLEACSDENRLALFARWGEGKDRSPAGMLKLALEMVGADRGFVARVSDTGKNDIEVIVGLERRRAVDLLEDLLIVGDEPGPRLVLDADRRESGGSQLVKSYFLLPLNVGVGVKRWVYLDKVAGGSEGRFGKRDVDLLVVFLKMASRDADLETESRVGKPAATGSKCCSLEDVVTEDPALKRILKMVPKISCSKLSVLLRGETGTGKQVIAEAIHSSSDRRDKPFVTVSCAALPEGLLETELFGHLKGSFTGADRDKTGLVEEANGGTLFLDEIEKASVAVQGKLLRVLDTGEVRPVGSTQSHNVDIRVICATSKMDLETEIREGRFLSDLFYRLNDIMFTIPRLREREEDVLVLAEYFRNKYNREMGRTVTGIDPGARDALKAYSWPGNVRELEKAIKLAVVLADDDGRITRDLLPPEVVRGSMGGEVAGRNGGTLKEMVEAMEREQILKALERSSGNKSEAARILGITRKGLANKIQRYNLKPL